MIAFSAQREAKTGFLLLLCFLYLTMACAQQALRPYCPTNFPGVNECEYIFCNVCNLNGYMGSTANFAPDPDGDLNGQFCATVDGTQYIGFVAGSTALTSITATTSNCTGGGGVDLGIMYGCDLFPVLACAAAPPAGPTTVSAYLTPGAQYLLVVDGTNGSVCDFTLTVTPANGTAPPDIFIPPVTPPIQGDFSVCPNAVTEYTIGPVSYEGTFTWTAPPGALINGQPSPALIDAPGGATVTVTWGTTGGQLCVQPSNFCNEGSTRCVNVVVTPIPTTIRPPVTLCAEEAPYELPWGEDAYGSGTYSAHLYSYQGCDSFVQQTVTIIPPKIRYLPPTGLCPGECVTVCGEQFCAGGTYTAHCTAANGCDSSVVFTITPINPVAEILGGGNLTCTTASVTLHSAASPGAKTWTNAAGQTVGTGDSIVVSTPGTFILTTSLIFSTKTCTSRDTVLVVPDHAIPPINAIGGGVDCDTVPLALQGNTPVSPATFAWSGPNGFTSSAQNPPVSIPGLYTVTITNPANGCTNVDTALVTICCHTFAGTLDTAAVHICGEKTISIVYHNDEVLEPGDGLVFILYADPANPAGSILEYTGAPAFPFVPGLVQLSVPYFVAVAAGHLLAGDSLDLSDPCFSFSPGPEVEWLPKPVISVQPVPPEMCKGDCVDVTFNFSGTPPFQFHYDITQNGKLVYSRDESSDALQKTVSICPSAFNPPGGAGALNFTVNYFRDLHCTCTD